MTDNTSPPPSPKAGPSCDGSNPDRPPAGGGTNDLLAMLARFREVAMPAFLRRMHQWNGLDPNRDPGVADDLMHTLTVDCLEHPELIRAMNQPARHHRWLQLAERHLYQTRFRHRRRHDPATQPDERPARTEDAGLQVGLQGLPGDQRGFAKDLLQVAEHFRNGRLHLEATARRMGMRVPRLRQRWQGLTTALGIDDSAYQEMERRLALALAGFAADLLRDQGLVRVWGQPPRHRPDPDSRVRTILRLRERMAVRPLTPAARRAVQLTQDAIAAHRRGTAIGPHAGALLACALELSPEDRAVALWCAEAYLATGELAGALAMVRLARRLGCDPTAAVLPRARTLELRHRPLAAAGLLARARRRLGPRPKPALDASLRALRKGPGVPTAPSQPD